MVLVFEEGKVKIKPPKKKKKNAEQEKHNKEMLRYSSKA